jgi:chemotaxis protein histidine kinase CheA
MEEGDQGSDHDDVDQGLHPFSDEDAELADGGGAGRHADARDEDVFDEESAALRLQKKEKMLRDGTLSDEDEQRMDAEAHLERLHHEDDPDEREDAEGDEEGWGDGDWREHAKEHLEKEEAKMEKLSKKAPGIQAAESPEEHPRNQEAKGEKLSNQVPGVESLGNPKEELKRALASLKQLGQFIPKVQVDKAFETVSKLENKVFHTSA